MAKADVWAPRLRGSILLNFSSADVARKSRGETQRRRDSATTESSGFFEEMPLVLEFSDAQWRSGDGYKAALAEREGFEPPIRLPVCRISSAVHSTTLPPLQAFVIWAFGGA